MNASSNEDESPLLALPVTSMSSASRRLQARRYLAPPALSSKAKGKQRAISPELDLDPEGSRGSGVNVENEDDESLRRMEEEVRGRCVTIIFSNEEGGGDLELWVEEGETVASVKDQIRHLRPALALLSLRLIHAGRLLTDGILLLPWLRSLEERVKRQSNGVGADLDNVLKEVGQALGDESPPIVENRVKGKEEDGKVWLHCNVGPKMEEVKSGVRETEPTPAQPTRRGFDVLLDAGLSPEDVANMRRQFYAGRGEEVPEGLDGDGANDEHARALEEQWIEGDLTAETALTTTEGTFTSTFNGLIIGFLLPLFVIFFFQEPPLPNFFDAEAEMSTLTNSLFPLTENPSSNPTAQTSISERRNHLPSTNDSSNSDAIVSSEEREEPSIRSSSLREVESRRNLQNLNSTSSMERTTSSRERTNINRNLNPSNNEEELRLISSRVAENSAVGSNQLNAGVFDVRTQMGLVIGTILNVVFASLRFLN
ncbi:hypothetical protein M231_02663 [Tremella mesenterica]|uniref:Ubiquitin-like domain-containing protein n=1 Tax=Tremella mesenterica TaxID=5217 RepID=A0A4Q1BQ41_TREME|nr:hypothetical protein M231_02663 [Tremella mesenterica]